MGKRFPTSNWRRTLAFEVTGILIIFGDGDYVECATSPPQINVNITDWYLGKPA